MDLEKDTGCWFRETEASDYLVKYGYKYCSIFKNKALIWPDARSGWVKKASVCLQDAIKEPENPTNCIRLEAKAYDSHPGCYRKAGFCELSKFQKTAIVLTAAGSDVLLAPVKSATQAFRLLKDCIKNVPNDAFALEQRVLQLAETGKYPRVKLAMLLWTDKVSERKLENYVRYSLRRLLGVSSGTPQIAVEAYASIYGRETEESLPSANLEDVCVTEASFDKPVCKRAAALAGSRKAVISLRSIPNQVSDNVVDQILEYKGRLEKE